MKCLPQSKIKEVKGNVLHDWHAEILALRAFNRFLVDECAELVARSKTEREEKGHWVRWRRRSERSGQNDAVDLYQDGGELGAEEQEQPFELQDDVEIHMYCSEAPCGDVSMELTMAEQEDATPWASPNPTTPGTQEDSLLGRGHFDHLGIVRRKPSRPDAPPTLSKSCSDKLALKQCTSLLSGLTSRIVWPGNAYLSSLVLPKVQIVPEAVQRAFGREGRMKGVADVAGSDSWSRGGYAFRPFEVKGTGRGFGFSKRAAGEGAVPSNLSILYTPLRQEIVINGVLQGRKQLDPRGASCVSRRAMWRAVLDLGLPTLATGLRGKTYGEVKGASVGRERVKREVRALALRGWRRNVGDEAWGLDEGIV